MTNAGASGTVNIGPRAPSSASTVAAESADVLETVSHVTRRLRVSPTAPRGDDALEEDHGGEQDEGRRRQARVDVELRVACARPKHRQDQAQVVWWLRDGQRSKRRA